MDPIHPITPRPPALAPIEGGRGSNPSERAARDRREQRKRATDRDRRRQQHTPDQQHSPYPGEEDGPHHIDVRA